jgi:Smg protein
MIDILVYLFENYHDFSVHPNHEALVRKLGAVGFDAKEIGEALGWLTELKDSGAWTLDQDSRSTRVLSGEESGKLGVDCHRFLLFLESAGITNGAQREIIIDRAMVVEDHPVPLSKFKVIVLMVLWSTHGSLDPLIIEELLSEDEGFPRH